MTPATRAAGVEMWDRLSDCDRAVVATLARLRLASSDQLRRLHFATEPNTLRSVQRQLTRLSELDVLHRLDRQIGGVRAGSRGYVYSLDRLGQLLAGLDDGPGRRPWTPSLPFVRHRLAITELYCRLVEASRQSELELIEFVAEPACWRSFPAPLGGRLWVKPDAFLALGSGEWEHRWWVEVDCATESATVLRRKAEAYGRYRASGREEAVHGVFPLVLFTVPTERRRRQIAEQIESWPVSLGRLFRVALADEALAALVGMG
jgi:hypothetical protein